MNFTWPFINSGKKNLGRGSLTLDRNYRDVNYRISISVIRGIICSTALLGNSAILITTWKGALCISRWMYCWYVLLYRIMLLAWSSTPVHSKHTKPNIYYGIKHGAFHDFDSSWCGLLRYKAHVTALRVTWVVFIWVLFGNLEVRFCGSLLVGYNREPAC